ncbi:MAG: hypothetical protein ATN33_03125 [Epulopiscium sp. Nele67-Bin001]|nr:MAG: hypothetical protein ATN33_03125 [Epulopiscium sp. Nele67-Bin001]
MKKKVFVSADWKEAANPHSWDKNVVDRIRKWEKDNRYAIDITCTDEVHDSVVDKEDCRRCDIKEECATEIKKSDVVIFVVGDKTGDKSAGPCDTTSCSPAYSGKAKQYCTKHQPNIIVHGAKMSYLQYEITTAVLNNKKIIVVFNAACKRESWIPSWYKTLQANYRVNELCQVAFWKDSSQDKDCYQDIKQYLF